MENIHKMPYNLLGFHIVEFTKTRITRNRDEQMALPELGTDPSPEEIRKLLQQARKASDLLKALSHETRLLILCLLNEGEKSVSELEIIMALPQAAVSQQLARLRFDRLVSTRREGRQIYYRIASDEIAAIIGQLYQMFCAPVRSATND